ncbi:MAG TPA: pitrilysin family protein [Pyrinomonadaceae bacterium]|jgi:predicted Zn-dependent peptidase|nr:pitrilysin family protein [Pyrinomonadaceae bacterium]
MKESIRSTRFPNGLAILTEKMPDLRSATLGFWFRCGSRDEPAHLNGISHFIEHAVFKGTHKRTALDIAMETDRLGGNFDAFTMHEQTGFTIKVTDKAVPDAFDLLADMLTDPLFEDTELSREQKVIIEEMKMVEDSPEEFLSEIFQQNFFSGSGLALPIEGTEKTVLTFDSKITSDYHRAAFQPHNLVITAAGNLEHERIVELAEKFFASPASGRPLAAEVEAGRFHDSPSDSYRDGGATKSTILKNKPGLEQTHFILTFPWIEETSEKRYAGHLLETVLGNGTSSRLWQKIREERGLAYSVGASGVSYRDLGAFNIFAATSPEQFEETVELATAEVRRIESEPVSEAELTLAKEQTAANLLLSLEDSGTRAGNLAQHEITFGRQISVDETLQKLEQVTTKEIMEIAEEFFVSDKLVLTALGNFDEK